MSGTIVLTQTDTPTAPSAGQTALSFPATLLNQLKFVDGDGNTNILYFPAGGGTVTLPGTGTAALLATENVFAAAQTIGNLNLSGNVIASTSGAVTVTPLAGQNFNVNLSGAGYLSVEGYASFGVSDKISLSSVGATDEYYLSQNYSNNNGTETVSVAARSSWRTVMRNATTFEYGIDFRAESAAVGAFTRLVTVRSTGNVLIGTQTDVTSAQLQIGGTTGALLLSRLSTTQRDDDLTTPINGMILYNSSTNKFQGYENGTWVNLI